MKKTIIFLLTCVLLAGTTSGASNISHSIGETWITWNWGNLSSVDVYIDGRLVEAGTTFQYYYLTGLNPNEEHRIDLRLNSSSTLIYDTDTTTTSTPQLFLYILLGLGTIIGLIAAIIRNPIHQILTATLSAVLCIGVSLIGLRTLPGLTGIGFIIGAFAGIFVIWSLYKTYLHIQNDRFGDY